MKNTAKLMQFIDEARIYIRSGSGGNGAVSFHREKYIDRGGPDGGDGGKGGSLIFKSNRHLNTLLKFRFNRHFMAQDGENGKGGNRSGKSKPSMVIEVPVGTQIFSEEGDLCFYDFRNDQEQFEILKGGKGGLGNAHFKSSINKSPRRRTEGEPGEEMNISLKLKLLSDAGLVGLPNAGKSTFLARSTSAKPKIADYPFTTLKPSLGVVYVSDEEFVLADIPGLIAGAHEGTGLGDRFLKHIERCGVLIHLIDATIDDVQGSYNIIRTELESYSPLLKDKTEIICLNKIDSLLEDEIADKQQRLADLTGKNVYLISGYTGSGIDLVLKKALEEIKNANQSSN